MLKQMSINYLLIILCFLLSVAYLTLLERKILSYMQLRNGPNNVGFMQPWADAINLFTNEFALPAFSNNIIFILAPLWALTLCFLIWSSIYTEECQIDFNWGLIYFIIISSLNVYSIVLAGWASNSVYGNLGCYRSIAQIISYEVSLALIFLCLIILTTSFNLWGYSNWSGLIFLPIWFVWFSSLLAEVNRSPYDFAEGESELVSGFNVEYSSGAFSLLFLAEYGNIIFLSYLTSNLIFNGSNILTLSSLLTVIWTRGSFPRLRYDNLILIIWNYYLPFIITLFMLFFAFSTYLELIS